MNESPSIDGTVLPELTRSEHAVQEQDVGEYEVPSPARTRKYSGYIARSIGSHKYRKAEKDKKDEEEKAVVLPRFLALAGLAPDGALARGLPTEPPTRKRAAERPLRDLG